MQWSANVRSANVKSFIVQSCNFSVPGCNTFSFAGVRGIFLYSASLRHPVRSLSHSWSERFAAENNISLKFAYFTVLILFYPQTFVTTMHMHHRCSIYTSPLRQWDIKINWRKTRKARTRDRTVHFNETITPLSLDPRLNVNYIIHTYLWHRINILRIYWNWQKNKRNFPDVRAVQICKFEPRLWSGKWPHFPLQSDVHWAIWGNLCSFNRSSSTANAAHTRNFQYKWSQNVKIKN